MPTRDGAPRADDDDFVEAYGMPGGMPSGVLLQLNCIRRPRLRKREFPPGFHGAAPGPSHDETPRPRKPRRRKGEDE